MNYIDLILIAIVGLAVFHGWRRGFIDSTSEIMIWLGSFVLALLLSGHVARLFHLFFDVTAIWIAPLSFILMLLVGSRIIFILSDSLTRQINEQTHQHPANKIAGIIPGFLYGLLYASLLSFFLVSYPLGDASNETEKSRIATKLTEKPEWLEGRLSELFDDLRFKLGSSLTIHPQGKDLIKLPFKTTDIRVRKDLELRMLDLVNRERKKEGLKLLRFDEELARVARSHSKDMFERGYFSHYTPEAKSPFDRIRKEKIKFRIGKHAENIQIGQSLSKAEPGDLVIYSNDNSVEILRKWKSNWNFKERILNSAYSKFGKPQIGDLCEM